MDKASQPFSVLLDESNEIEYPMAPVAIIVYVCCQKSFAYGWVVSYVTEETSIVHVLPELRKVLPTGQLAVGSGDGTAVGTALGRGVGIVDGNGVGINMCRRVV